jgi:hypothetical protein
MHEGEGDAFHFEVRTKNHFKWAKSHKVAYKRSHTNLVSETQKCGNQRHARNRTKTMLDTKLREGNVKTPNQAQRVSIKIQHIIHVHLRLQVRAL